MIGPPRNRIARVAGSQTRPFNVILAILFIPKRRGNDHENDPGDRVQTSKE
jgi:hypothetical protein